MVRAAAKTLASSSTESRSGGRSVFCSGSTLPCRQKSDCWPGLAVHHPVAELVADGEPAPRRPLPRLRGVHPDLTGTGEEQPRDRLAGLERGSAGSRGHVLDLSDQQAVTAVRDVVDRDRQLFAVPDPSGHAGEHGLRLLLDLVHDGPRLTAGEQAVHLVGFL